MLLQISGLLRERINVIKNYFQTSKKLRPFASFDFTFHLRIRMGWITFVGRESQEQTVKLVVITAPRVGEVDKDIPKEDKNIN